MRRAGRGGGDASTEFRGTATSQAGSAGAGITGTALAARAIGVVAAGAKAAFGLWCGQAEDLPGGDSW